MTESALGITQQNMIILSRFQFIVMLCQWSLRDNLDLVQYYFFGHLHVTCGKMNSLGCKNTVLEIQPISQLLASTHPASIMFYFFQKIVCQEKHSSQLSRDCQCYTSFCIPPTVIKYLMKTYRGIYLQKKSSPLRKKIA